MPASRKARAMTFAPRSCPSNPGFATSTRIFVSAIAHHLTTEGTEEHRGNRQLGISSVFLCAPSFKILHSGYYVECSKITDECGFRMITAQEWPPPQSFLIRALTESLALLFRRQ